MRNKFESLDEYLDVIDDDVAEVEQITASAPSRYRDTVHRRVREVDHEVSEMDISSWNFG